MLFLISVIAMVFHSKNCVHSGIKSGPFLGSPGEIQQFARPEFLLFKSLKSKMQDLWENHVK